MTDSEISVYIALLEIGSSATGKIVEKSKVSSSKIYEILDKLIQKGLVSFIVKSGIKYFEAAPPSRIMDYMQEKEEAFLNQKKELQQILPELELKRALSKYKSEATIFKGVKGTISAFQQLIHSLKKGDEWVGYIIPPSPPQLFNTFRTLHTLRASKGIHGKFIFHEHARDEGAIRASIPLTQVRYLSGDSKNPVIVNVAGSITIINIQSDDPTLFLIDNKAIADSFRHEFEKLWNQDVSMYEGVESVTGFFRNILQDLEKGDEYFVINGNYGENKELAAFFQTYHKERQKKGIKANLLYNSNLHDVASSLALPPAECKFLPPDFKSPLQVTFYGEKLFMSLWKQNPVGFLIKRKEVVDAFKAYFDSLWQQDTIISKGFDALKTEIEGLLTSYSGDESYDVLGAAYGQGASIPKYVEFFSNIHKKRVELGLPTRLLFQQGVESIVQSRPDYQKLILTNGEYRFLPYKTDFPVGIYLSKQKTVLLIYDKEPLIITINNPVIARMFKLHFESMWNQEVKIFRGIAGAHAAWNAMLDELESGEEYYVLGATWLGQKGEVPSSLQDFHKRRISKKVRVKFLFASGTEKVVEKYKDLYLTLAEAKYLPPDVYEGIQFNIYKNKVLMLVWKEDEPLMFLIEDKHVYETFLTYFHNLWNQETRVVKGMNAIKHIFDEIVESGHCDFIGARGYFVGRSAKNYIDDWEKKGIKNGFTMRNIVDPGVKGHRITTFPFAQTKYTLPEMFSKLSVFWIYGEKVIISNWTQDEPIAIIIENKQLHDMYKQQFEILWASEGWGMKK